MNANLVEQQLFQKLCAVITNTFCVILILEVVHFQGNHNHQHVLHLISSLEVNLWSCSCMVCCAFLLKIICH